VWPVPSGGPAVVRGSARQRLSGETDAATSESSSGMSVKDKRQQEHGDTARHDLPLEERPLMSRLASCVRTLCTLPQRKRERDRQRKAGKRRSEKIAHRECLFQCPIANLCKRMRAVELDGVAQLLKLPPDTAHSRTSAHPPHAINMREVVRLVECFCGARDTG
jgi:hypothetical protein